MPERSLAGVRRTLLPLLVATLLAGLLGMHALVLHRHGAGGDRASGGHVAMAMGPAAGAAVDAADPGTPRHDWLMLCVAVLTAAAGAAGALLGLVALARRRPLARRPRSWSSVAAVPRPPPRGGPPAFLRFAVIRC